MKNRIDDTRIFRLAAMLYENGTYNVGKDSTLRKVIESILVTNENKSLRIIELINVCSEEYGLIVDEEEVRRIIIEKFSDKFHIERYENGDSFIINLSQHRYQVLKERQSKYNIINYIDEFIDQSKYNENINAKELILKFLHQLFTSNLNCYEHFLKGKSDASTYSIDYKGYGNEEIEIINGFLAYENENKDKAVFDIVNLSLEYCILTGDNNQIYIEGLNNKVFYLDTNIIYRALGINGENRRILTIKFLEKCIQHGIIVRISKFTIDEFNSSIDYHIKKISKAEIDNINPQLYMEYTSGRDIINMYFEWKSGRQNTDKQLFRAYIKSLYEQLIKEYGIEEDHEVYFDENNYKVKETLDKCSNSISTYKVLESDASCMLDAKNILLINSKRKLKSKYSTKFLETRYFMISTDQKLKEWNYREIESQVPVVLLPTQWLNIILRYSSRTHDDFKSFSNFIMLNKIKEDVDKEKLIAILNGISELTQDMTYQKLYAEQLIEQKVNNIIDGEDIGIIYENTKEFVSKSIEEEVKSKDSEIEEVRINNEELNKKMINKDKQIDSLKNKVKIEEDIKTLKKKLFITVFLLLSTICWISLQFIFLKWDYNIPNQILTYISTNQLLNEAAKNFAYCGNYGILALIVGTLCMKIKKYTFEMRKLYKEKKSNKELIEKLIGA